MGKAVLGVEMILVVQDSFCQRLALLRFPNGILVAVFCRSLSVQQLVKYREKKDGIFASKT